MKVIFLDIDGVLIPERSILRQDVSPANLHALNHLLRVSQAKIVVSSCHRLERTVSDIRDLLVKWGVEGEIIDCTGAELSTRGEELAEWLSVRGSDVESFVILDDNANLDPFLPMLVQIDCETGMSLADAERALTILDTVSTDNTHGASGPN